MNLLISTPYQTRPSQQTLTPAHAAASAPAYLPAAPVHRPVLQGKLCSPLAGMQGKEQAREAADSHCEEGRRALVTRGMQGTGSSDGGLQRTNCRNAASQAPADLPAQNLFCQAPRGLLGTRQHEQYSCPGPPDFALKKIALIVLSFRSKPVAQHHPNHWVPMVPVQPGALWAE